MKANDIVRRWPSLGPAGAYSTGAGEAIELVDGSVWFHPYNGAEPTRIKPPSSRYGERRSGAL
jgi:hypothetical protein